MGNLHFMLSGVEHEKSFITLGLALDLVRVLAESKVKILVIVLQPLIFK